MVFGVKRAISSIRNQNHRSTSARAGAASCRANPREGGALSCAPRLGRGEASAVRLRCGAVRSRYSLAQAEASYRSDTPDLSLRYARPVAPIRSI